MKHHTRVWVLFVIAALSIQGGGCGKDSSRAHRPRLVFETGESIPSAPFVSRDLMAGGICSPGDINGDGYGDLIVGSSRYPGAIAAFSGKDGAELWRVKGVVGKEAEAAGEMGHSFRWFSLVSDVNGDGIGEIVAPNDWGYKEGFIISGKDGEILARHDGSFGRPVVRDDVLTPEGAKGFLIPAGNDLDAVVLSREDLSEKAKFEDILGVKDKQLYPQWIICTYDDVDSDGTPEYVAAINTPEGTDIYVLSGKDFAKVRTFTIPADPVRGARSYASVGDVNGDGTSDLVRASAAGRGERGSLSYLAAYSGADGAKIWEVLGDSLPGGSTLITIDAKTGEQKNVRTDIEFGKRVVPVGDLSGDGVQEIAAALPTLIGDKRVMAVLIFSGADGALLAKLGPGSGKAALRDSQMAFLESADGKGNAGLVVSARFENGKSGVAVFVLPKLKP